MGWKTIKRLVGHGQTHYRDQKKLSHVLICHCSPHMQVEPFLSEKLRKISKAAMRHLRNHNEKL